MEQPRKIELYEKRAFGEKLNATFDFLKENWKPLLKFTTYLLLPLSLIQAAGASKMTSFGMNLSMLQQSGDDILSILDSTFLTNYLLTLLCAVIGTGLLASIVYACMKQYATSENRLNGITLTDLKPLLLKYFGRSLMAIIFTYAFIILIVVLIALLAVATLWSLLLTIPAFVACCIPMALFTPIYLFEDISIFDAFGKAFRLGFPTWGGVFLIGLVMGLLSMFINSVASIPYTVATMVKYLFSMSELSTETTVSFGYNCLVYVLAVISTFSAYIGAIFLYLGMGYQYGHASEKIDGITITNDIENFDNL